MTVTVELKNEHALRLLEELEQLGALTIQDRPEHRQPVTGPRPVAERTFTAIQLDTRGFKFNREEANER